MQTKRRRRSREEWVEIIGDLERTGLSVEEFADFRELSVKSVRRWRRCISETTESGGISLLAVDVVREASTTQRPAAIVVAVAGVELRVAVGTDVEYVGALTRELSRC